MLIWCRLYARLLIRIMPYQSHAWKEGCHKFTSGLLLLFSLSEPEPGNYQPIREIAYCSSVLGICGYQQITTSEGVKEIQNGHTTLWPSQRPTLCICAYANMYLNSHLALFDKSNPVLNGFGCKMVITPKPRWNNEFVCMLSLLEFITPLGAALLMEQNLICFHSQLLKGTHSLGSSESNSHAGCDMSSRHSRHT